MKNTIQILLILLMVTHYSATAETTVASQSTFSDRLNPDHGQTYWPSTTIAETQSKILTTSGSSVHTLESWIANPKTEVSGIWPFKPTKYNKNRTDRHNSVRNKNQRARKLQRRNGIGLISIERRTLS